MSPVTHSRKGNQQAKGFTLIELSIVLVIIGLITGGILVGQTLIRQSQINSAMMDTQRYISATTSFQQKYGSLPGDMANATSYWGAESACPLPPGWGSFGSTVTCNGNGDGKVQYINEPFLFWQHLANAQLIQGSYTGSSWNSCCGPNYSAIGTNIPGGRLSGLGFGINYEGVLSGDSVFFDGIYGHVITLGAVVAVFAPHYPVGSIITTQEAQGFDSKYDDGLPATGNVRTYKNGNPSYSKYCATTNVSSTALYNTAANGTNSTGLQCGLVVITGF